MHDPFFDLCCPVLSSAVADTAPGCLTKLALSVAELRRQAAQTDPDPSEAQKEHGNYKKGKVSWKGLPVAIEVAKGNYRRGVGKDGEPWATLMKQHYGYFTGTEGADGDQVDVFLADDDLDSEIVFACNQVDPGTKKFDEVKVIAGVTSEARAREVYLSNYEKGWQGLDSVVPMTLDKFKKWLKSNRSTKSAFETKIFTVAADLDGTLAELQEPFDPDTIGEPRKNAKKAMKAFREEGARVIVNTVRGDTKQVEKWLKKHEIPYDYVNENPDQPEDSSSKLIADVYWDDRSVDAGPDDAWEEVLRRIKNHKAEKKK